MRVRRLQRQNEEGQWFDDAYAFEKRGGGPLVFRYNLTWERMGSTYNARLQESGVSLDEIETVVMPGRNWRWLPVEGVPDEEAEAFLEGLDDVCDIPRPRRVKIVEAVAAVD